MTDATKLAESLRAMRRNARNAYVSARPCASYSITMDAVRLGDLSDAADLIERQASELAEWRSVFGHLGATPAVLLTDEQVRDCIDSSTYAVCQVMAAEAMSLRANGKAVP